jgi:hypothetical protein
MRKFDIAQVCKVFEDSFQNVEQSDLMIIAHDLIGLNRYRNHFNSFQELTIFINKALDHIQKQNIKQQSVSFAILQSKLKQLVSL